MIRKSLLAEILLYAGIMVLGTWLLVELDAFDRLYAFSRAHEDWELDEFILLIPVGIICLVLYSLKRSRELRARALELEKARKELAEIHEQLVEMDQTRERFIAVSCHELKSPLSGIVHSLSLLELGGDENERKEAVDLAKSAARELASLIDGVLEFARLSNNEQDNLNTFPPQRLLDSVRTLALLQAEAKQLQLQTTLDADVPDSLIGNEAGVRLAILNLVGNAIKYTESGHVSVHLSWDGKYLIATVTDTGIGIPQDKLESVFKPFRKVDMTGGAGVGLGLAIANRLVNSMGGTIFVSSSVGKGTQFTLRVPAEPA
ncbi:sensor histidine kinase [Pseudodesulfovibrio portus]|uniref:histidine kinase n=1 Tax=Pseudodesulfovibrio portus TaxID=231439 RepID=A0ABM8AS99_9BACT|nr:HAMP domain-containing sensor histidine kinase [Pseudodesulfovibrio portus]BDQ34319.1 hypothetical protein JCM14722_18610 [Pseudodesulfovibrio portus]